MRKIIEYTVIQGKGGTANEAIGDRVNEYIRKGWELIGGTTCTIATGGVYYFQTMVKYEETYGKTPLDSTK